MGGKNWFKISGVSKNRGFVKSGVKLQCLTKANPWETCHGLKNQEVRKIEDSKNRDSTVLKQLFTSVSVKLG